MSDHMIQYACVGGMARVVHHTENLSDDEVRAKAFGYPRPGERRLEGRVVRYDRCPVCEVWTRSAGQLRTNLNCPAVIAALAAISHAADDEISPEGEE